MHKIASNLFTSDSGNVVDWYHGWLSRGKSEVLLRTCGDFLFRISESQRGKFVLSYKSDKSKVEHALIQHSFEEDSYQLFDASGPHHQKFDKLLGKR